MRRAILLTLLALPVPARAQPTPLENWVLVDGDDNQMNGSVEDIERARAQQRHGEPLLWFRRGDHAYVIRDAGVLARLRAAWEPARALGKTMGALGKKVGALGAKQGVLGEQMGVLGARQGALGARIATMRRDDPERAQIRREMAETSAQMDALKEPMERLNDAMRPLSAEMQRRGAEMQRIAAEARQKMAVIIDDALARGLGSEVDER
jgi:hypothetical protein